MQELTDYMFDHDVLNIRQRELLHLKWTDRVYDPIQSHILSVISGKDFENLLLHKRLLYNEFLAKSNCKVFLGVFDYQFTVTISLIIIIVNIITVMFFYYSKMVCTVLIII